VSSLYADARSVIDSWTAPSAAQEKVRGRFVDLLSDGPAVLRFDHPGAHVTASAIVLSAERDRVLLCLHGRFNEWVQLGGHCEDEDTSLAHAALREAAEESSISGLTVVAGPIDLDIHAVTCRYGPSLHYDVRFAVLAPPGAVEQVSSESHALGWFPPDALPSPLASSTDRLVEAALASVVG
jgi:8-oxo-dGTP pyrophosphatase MutT (NUDIX family)